MKAEELRIGNLFDNHGTICHVMSINKNAAEFGYFEDSIGFVRMYDNQSLFPKPIPITVEWGLKFGFKRNEYFLELRIDNWDIHYNLKSKKLTIEADGAYDENGQFDITDKVKYIHQLQNLYYALTGEELNY